MGVPPMRLALLLLLAAGAAGRKSKSRDKGFCASFQPLPDVARRQLPAVSKAVKREACAYLGAKPPAPRLSLGRWTEDVDAKLGPTVALVEKALRKPGVQVMAGGGGSEPPWVVLQYWIESLALESEAFELRALSAPIMEAMWHAMTTQYGLFGTAGLSQRDGAAPLQFDADDNAYLLRAISMSTYPHSF